MVVLQVEREREAATLVYLPREFITYIHAYIHTRIDTYIHLAVACIQLLEVSRVAVPVGLPRSVSTSTPGLRLHLYVREKRRAYAGVFLACARCHVYVPGLKKRRMELGV